MLQDHEWRFKYTPDDGNLVNLFYVPALKVAKRYDRLTGYFSAGALELAARGIEGLVQNEGHMRLLVGCTLDPPEIEAIEKGERLRDLVEQHLAQLPLKPKEGAESEALELLAWMVAHERLEIKVAVPCDSQRKPIPSEGIFHEKAGIIEDGDRDRIAWNGSLNETAAGWERNWESINVFTSWGTEPARVDAEEANFSRAWCDKARHFLVLTVPDAARQELMRYLPTSDQPARLKGKKRLPKAPKRPPQAENEVPVADLRSRVWAFIQQAPNLPGGGARVGEATSTVTPWPHQVRAFQRMYETWPPKLLIADEVGLGKTIQAGLLLRQAWLAGRANRILILAPRGILSQWQIELREKFNLNWPIYDGRKLVWYPSPAMGETCERKVSRNEWFNEPAVIASSHLMRRRERQSELLEKAPPWDLVVLDEAHHARRRAAGTASEGGPNALLRLMRELKDRTDGLVLLTATPMQVHPVEVWDLLSLLGVPPEWTEESFLQFFEDVNETHPSSLAFDRMASLFRSIEDMYGELSQQRARRLTKLSRLKSNKVLRALRSSSSIPRRQLETAERRAAIRILKASTPIRQLVSRHTRELLRRYTSEGLLDAPIADRKVNDYLVDMTPAERSLYEAVEDYIARTYNQASVQEKSAVGFVMTVYRRRLASSFRALRCTLEKRLAAMSRVGHLASLDADDDALDEISSEGDLLDVDDVEALDREGLVAEEREAIQDLLRWIGRLPPDSKLGHLNTVLAQLRREGFKQVMVFTQYTDTMDFLRDALSEQDEWSLMCFSGRGGEVPSAMGDWRQIGRDETKRRFRAGESDVLLCTDAAAEGLNFQFCGALVNYDVPWNPMRVEQRIGRIDRLGQVHPAMHIVNLHYEDTVETDVYQALRERINLFETVVGPLQPILSRLSRSIADSVLSGGVRGDSLTKPDAVAQIEEQVAEARTQGLNIDEAVEDGLDDLPERPPSPITMADLDRIIASPDLLPPGTEVRPMAPREYRFQAAGMGDPLRVTTDPAYYEEHSESVELWSPGNALFAGPEMLSPMVADSLTATSLHELLEEAS